MGLSPKQKVRINGRPVMIASYMEADASNLKAPMRNAFPRAGDDYSGGQSDGKVYEAVFAGRTLEDTYAMIKSFLREEGYIDVPLPAGVAELQAFQLSTRNRQVLMFDDNGYVHNPVKILFPLDRRKKTTLVLKLYNEQADKHLLRFHNKWEDRK
ncbi:MAG: hypothetical protein AAFZ63_02440 [Bacteroidota bacterium]